MATMAKFNGVAVSGLSKLLGVAKSGLSKWNGLTLTQPSSLIDSYASTNANDFLELNNGGLTKQCQVVSLASPKTITEVRFYLSKLNSPTGNITVELYATTGTVGSSAVPTGSALATSAAIGANTLTTSMAEYAFTSLNYAASAGGLALALCFSGGDASNTVKAWHDSSSPSHGGNLAYYNGSWASSGSGYDLCFEVYGY